MVTPSVPFHEPQSPRSPPARRRGASPRARASFFSRSIGSLGALNAKRMPRLRSGVVQPRLMVSLIWIPKHHEPRDADSWQREIDRVYGDDPDGRVELEQQGQAWRVRMAIRVPGGPSRLRASAVIWYDLSEQVTAALRAAGKPVGD